MATTMNMSGYEIEREAVAVEEYGEEVMCSGWNPQLAAVGAESIAETGRRDAFPPGLAHRDVDAFLQKMYRFQR